MMVQMYNYNALYEIFTTMTVETIKKLIVEILVGEGVFGVLFITTFLIASPNFYWFIYYYVIGIYFTLGINIGTYAYNMYYYHNMSI